MPYTADINITFRSFLSAKERLVVLDIAAKEIGLRINENEAEVMMQANTIFNILAFSYIWEVSN